jgi:metallo-beta-lactamase class B
MKNFIASLILAFISISCSQQNNEYLTIDEATAFLKVPEAAAKFVEHSGPSPELPPAFRPPYTPIKPVKLFDNLYFTGTTAVGSFIIDTGDGLFMIDTGNGDEDAAIMVEGMKELKLDPSQIKVIFISHEHFDHYGGVQYLKKNVCPDAKVAMSLTGWNMLQSVPMEWAYIGTRPESVDIYLVDGMKIRTGRTWIQIVSTPGHSPGCVSFIFPVTDNGDTHIAGAMGGSAVWPTQVEAKQYISSVEYFKAFASEAGCDVGLFLHSQERHFTGLRNRKPGETNPLVLGREKFDTEYLGYFRRRYQMVVNTGLMNYPEI